MNRYKDLVIQVKRFPESQEIMDNPDWFSIGDYGDDMIIGDSAYARVMEEDEYILVDKTTADEYNKEYERIVKKTNEFISGNDPGDENGS